MILVTGGTGTVGRALVSDLAVRPGVHVRVLTRSASVPLPAGVERRVGDLGDQLTLRAAMQGCTRLFLLSTGVDLTVHDTLAADCAVSAGLERIVKVSALGVSHDADDPITNWHRGGEVAIRASGIPAAMLRPTGFMSNVLNWVWSIAASGTVSAPYPNGRTALIDPVDIAEVGAHALLSSTVEREIYDLTGPQPLSPREQVNVLAQELGRDLRYEPEDPSTTRSTLENYGMTPELAGAVVASFASAEELWNATPLPTVKQVLGRDATDFRAWARRNRDVFEVGAAGGTPRR